jgi:K319-like protein/ASPM-SPD-2-Hydin domain-containing protein
VKRAACLALASFFAAACGEDRGTLVAVPPHILVCSTPDIRSDRCGGPFDLGDRPIKIASPVKLFVQNRGDGPLNVLGITAKDAAVVPEETKLKVGPSSSRAFVVQLTPPALGAGSADLSIASDDKQRTPLAVTLRWNGIPKPEPKIVLCTDTSSVAIMSGAPGCTPEISVDFGLVRRTEVDSRSVLLANAGSAPLDITGVRFARTSTSTREFSIATSTKSGQLPPGASVPISIVYRPEDGGTDRIDLLVDSNDPLSPEAKVHLSASSSDDLAPLARAFEARTGSTSAVVTVGDRVVLDGTASADAEHDPLLYAWTLTPADRSAAAIDDPHAARVSFVPDTAGTYVARLVVTDSIGLMSAAASVEIWARPLHALRAILDWQVGGDLDLHLVRSPSALFSADDCDFMNPRPTLSGATSPDNDPTLISDATHAPGTEEIDLVSPLAGTYALYVHDFDDAGIGPAAATVRIVFDDASIDAYSSSMMLPATCSVWYVGDISFPQKMFAPINTMPAPICR